MERRKLVGEKFSVLIMILMILTTVMVSLTSLTTNVVIRNSGTIVRISPLHVEGRYIKDILGNVVTLRGINKHGFEDYPTGIWQRPDGSITNKWEPETVKANLNAMKTWGINTIRIHTAINFWKYNIGNFRQNIKDLLTWAGERGIYVIYDCYSVVDYFSEGCQPDPLPYPPYNSRPDVIGSEDEFVEFWVSLANELKSYPNVLFELWNEPHIHENYTWAEMRESWKNVTQRCINAIRATGASNIIVASWCWGIWANLNYPWELPPGPVRDPAATLDWVMIFNLSDPLDNILYDTHLYRGDIIRSKPEWVDCWTYDDIKLGLQYCWVEYVLYNITKPLLLGEVGPNMWASGEELERELAFYNNTLKLCKEYEMSFCGFWWWPTGKYAHLTNQPNYQPNRAGEILIKSLQTLS
ncbi:MAG: cellulase family glycosylhydrolase [Candidatus Bathyarchaeia archaeon]